MPHSLVLSETFDLEHCRDIDKAQVFFVNFVIDSNKVFPGRTSCTFEEQQRLVENFKCGKKHQNFPK
jgi:hypothetical protein